MKKRYRLTLPGDNPIKERQMDLTALELSAVTEAFADTTVATPVRDGQDVAFHVETLVEVLDSP